MIAWELEAVKIPREMSGVLAEEQSSRGAEDSQAVEDFETPTMGSTITPLQGRISFILLGKSIRIVISNLWKPCEENNTLLTISHIFLKNSRNCNLLPYFSDNWSGFLDVAGKQYKIPVPPGSFKILHADEMGDLSESAVRLSFGPSYITLFLNSIGFLISYS